MEVGRRATERREQSWLHERDLVRDVKLSNVDRSGLEADSGYLEAPDVVESFVCASGDRSCAGEERCQRRLMGVAFDGMYAVDRGLAGHGVGVVLHLSLVAKDGLVGVVLSRHDDRPEGGVSRAEGISRHGTKDEEASLEDVLLVVGGDLGEPLEGRAEGGVDVELVGLKSSGGVRSDDVHNVLAMGYSSAVYCWPVGYEGYLRTLIKRVGAHLILAKTSGGLDDVPEPSAEFSTSGSEFSETRSDETRTYTGSYSWT